MMKTYHAKSELSINVRMDGGHRHVAFTPHTMGGSSLTTDDPELQSAIERHRLFGTRISVTVMREDTPKASQNPSAGSGNAQGSSRPSTAGKPCHEPQVLSFVSSSDAKEYLADHFGISRTQLKHRDQIERIAAEHGINIRLPVQDGPTNPTSLTSPTIKH